MKIIVASEYFYPDSRGGTELYVYQLVKELIEHGHDCMVISVSNIKYEDIFENIKIKYIPYNEGLYKEEDTPKNITNILDIVKDFDPDVFHLHTLSPSLGINHLISVKNAGYKTIFTAHVPGFTCTRGDLLFNGSVECDGFVSENKCWNCTMISKGFTNKFLRDVIRYISNYNLIRKSFPTLDNVQNKISDIDKSKVYIDKIIVVSEWQKRVLLLNDFDNSKISICRQAISPEKYIDSKKNEFVDYLRIGFIGRIVPNKGLHLLIDAINSSKSKHVELFIAGVYSYIYDDYYNELKRSSEKLKVNWLENLQSSEIDEFLDNLDVLVVPSLWLETGPYVIYEAFSRKIPVIAFRRGGAVELIDDGINGFLVDSKIELYSIISKIIEQPDLIRSFTSKIKIQRTTNQLYSETYDLYREVLR